jgi:hypothetical protein
VEFNFVIYIVANRSVAEPRPQNGRVQPLLCNRPMINGHFWETARYTRSRGNNIQAVKKEVFWDVAPCRCAVNRRFGGTYRQAIARQLPMTTKEGLLEAVFSVGSALKLYSEVPRPAEEFSWGLAVESSSAWKLRWDGAGVEKSSVADIRRKVTTWARDAEESPLLMSLLGNRC